jgi:hypothetical protein
LAFPRRSRVIEPPRTTTPTVRVDIVAMFRPGFRAFESAFRPARSSARFRLNKQYAQFRAYRQVRFGDRRPQFNRFQFVSSLFMRWVARPTFYRDIGLISVGAGGAYVYNLEEVPVGSIWRYLNCVVLTVHRFQVAAASTSSARKLKLG